jgi:hypothetical protein
MTRMKVKICDVNPEAESKLPENTADKSGVGVHYMDAYIKPMNTTLPDGTAISMKRKGLKLMLAYGDKKGEGLMRRFEHGPDIRHMLDLAMAEAFGSVGMSYAVEDGAIYVAPQA